MMIKAIARVLSMRESSAQHMKLFRLYHNMFFYHRLILRAPRPTVTIQSLCSNYPILPTCLMEVYHLNEALVSLMHNHHRWKPNNTKDKRNVNLYCQPQHRCSLLNCPEVYPADLIWWCLCKESCKEVNSRMMIVDTWEVNKCLTRFILGRKNQKPDKYFIDRYPICQHLISIFYNASTHFQLTLCTSN